MLNTDKSTISSSVEQIKFITFASIKLSTCTPPLRAQDQPVRQLAAPVDGTSASSSTRSISMGQSRAYRLLIRIKTQLTDYLGKLFTILPPASAHCPAKQSLSIKQQRQQRTTSTIGKHSMGLKCASILYKCTAFKRWRCTPISAPASPRPSYKR